MAGGHRIIVNYPWTFAQEGGVEAASQLDDNYQEVNQATITIRTQVLAGSYTLNADDNYSTFLCVPTNNMNLSTPSSMDTNFSFFVSNQSPNKTVTLNGAYTIANQQVLNPVIPGSFGSMVGVKGGLVVFDGSTLTMYPQLFIPAVGSPGITRGINNIALNATTSQINHNLGTVSAILIGAWTNWNTTTFITAQDANSITVMFNNPCPYSSGGQLQWSVTT